MKSRAVMIALLGVLLTAGCASTSSSATTQRTALSPNKVPDVKPPTKDSTIDDYLDYALQNNRGLRGAKSSWESATKRIKQARSLEDPKLSAEYMVEQHDMQYGVALTQSIPGFGKLRLRTDIAGSRAAASGHDYEAMRLMVFEQVVMAFYNYHYLQRSIAITDENISLLSQLEKVILTRHKNAKARYSDVLKVQVETDRLLNRRDSLKDMRPVISAELAALLDLPTNRLLPWPKVTRSGDALLPDDVLADMLEDLNPELKAMDATIKGLASAVKLTKRQYLPDFTVGAGLMVMPETESGDTPTDAAIKLGVSLPLWRGKKAAAVDEAELAHEAAVNRRKQLQSDLMVDLKKALFDLRDADRKINLFNESLIPKARQAFEVAKKEFMAGTVQFMALIDAQRTLFELSLMLERSQADREIALGEIGCCVGKYNVGTQTSDDRADKEGGK